MAGKNYMKYVLYGLGGVITIIGGYLGYDYFIATDILTGKTKYQKKKDSKTPCTNGTPKKDDGTCATQPATTTEPVKVPNLPTGGDDFPLHAGIGGVTGSRGSRVKQVQIALNKLGESLKEDGAFVGKTEAALKRQFHIFAVSETDYKKIIAGTMKVFTVPPPSPPSSQFNTNNIGKKAAAKSTGKYIWGAKSLGNYITPDVIVWSTKGEVLGEIVDYNEFTGNVKIEMLRGIDYIEAHYKYIWISKNDITVI